MSHDTNTKPEEQGAWDALLTEEPVEGESYIQPNIEIELPVMKRQACRDIVLEIKKFGISQRQTLYLINLLSLELEDNITMKAITRAIGENRKNVPVSKLKEIPTTTGLILSKPGEED